MDTPSAMLKAITTRLFDRANRILFILTLQGAPPGGSGARRARSGKRGLQLPPLPQTHELGVRFAPLLPPEPDLSARVGQEVRRQARVEVRRALRRLELRADHRDDGIRRPGMSEPGKEQAPCQRGARRACPERPGR